MEKQEILLESGTNELEIITFLLGAQTFGVNVVKVKSIQQYDTSTLSVMPMAHHALMGMILYRNKTMPLINLADALGLKNDESALRPIVIITEFNNLVTGFLVDGVRRIHRLYWSAFVPIDNFAGNHGAGTTGTIHVDGTDVMIVDLEYIISKIFPGQAISELNSEILKKQEKQTRTDVHIFFAEDSGTIRNNVVRILKNAGYDNIQVFENGQRAYEELISIRDQSETNESQTKALPDVMISDIEMPQMDGLTLCKKAKDDNYLKGITFIMFSSLINEQMIRKCKSVGADSYIAKPDMNKLVNMLDEMCLQKQNI